LPHQNTAPFDLLLERSKGMRTAIITAAAMLASVSLLAACNSTTTTADYARMDAYAKEHAPGARGAATPGDLAAIGLFKSSEQLRRDSNELAPAPSFANLRIIGPKS
jgi:hypothetical protein